MIQILFVLTLVALMVLLRLYHQKPNAKKTWVGLLLQIACTLLLIAYFVFTDVQKHVPALQLNSTSFAEADTWGFQNTVLPTRFYPIQDTPYVFLEFLIGVDKEPNQDVFHRNTVVIDADTQKRIFFAQWDDVSKEGIRKRRQSHSVSFFNAFMADNDLYFDLRRNGTRQYDLLMNASWVPDGIAKMADHYFSEHWLLSETSGLRLNKKLPKRALPIDGFNRWLQKDRTVPFVSDVYLTERTMDGDSFSGLHSWYGEKVTDYGYCRYHAFHDGLYLVEFDNRNQIGFLHRDSDTFRIFRNSELLRLLPEKPQGPISWIVPLTHTESSRYLFYFQVSGYPLFEMNLDRLKDGTIDEIFRVAAYPLQVRPVAALHDNQTLIGRRWYQEKEFSKTHHHVLYRIERNDDRFSMDDFVPIGSEQQDFQPSEIPYDNDRIVALSLDRLVMIRWDGTIEPVFPK